MYTLLCLHLFCIQSRILYQSFAVPIPTQSAHNQYCSKYMYFRVIWLRSRSRLGCQKQPMAGARQEIASFEKDDMRQNVLSLNCGLASQPHLRFAPAHLWPSLCIMYHTVNRNSCQSVLYCQVVTNPLSPDFWWRIIQFELRQLSNYLLRVLCA